MTSPRPDPPPSPAPACRRNRCGSRSGGTPSPSSATETSTSAPSRAAATRMGTSGEWHAALESRLSSTWTMRRPSAIIGVITTVDGGDDAVAGAGQGAGAVDDLRGARCRGRGWRRCAGWPRVAWRRVHAELPSPPAASCRSFNVPSSRGRGAAPPRHLPPAAVTGASHIDDILYMDSAMYKTHESHVKTANCREDAMPAAALLAFHHNLTTESSHRSGLPAVGARAVLEPDSHVERLASDAVDDVRRSEQRNAVAVLNATGPAVALWRDHVLRVLRPNRPPEAVGTLAARRLTGLSSTLEVDVSQAFVDPDGDPLTCAAASSAPQVGGGGSHGGRPRDADGRGSGHVDGAGNGDRP